MAAFHRAHEEIFAIQDADSGIEVIGWMATVSCRIRRKEGSSLAQPDHLESDAGSRVAYFDGVGRVPTQVRRFEALRHGEMVEGPFEQCWNCGAARVD